MTKKELLKDKIIAELLQAIKHGNEPYLTEEQREYLIKEGFDYD